MTFFSVLFPVSVKDWNFVALPLCFFIGCTVWILYPFLIKFLSFSSSQASTILCEPWVRATSFFERSESAVMHAKLPTSQSLRQESMNKFWKWWGVAVNGDRSLRSTATARLIYAPSIRLVHTAKESSLNNFLNSHKWPVLQKRSVPDYNEPLSSPIHAWAYNGFLQGGMHAVMEGGVPLSRRLITEALAPLWKWWMDMSPNWQCNQGGYMPFVLHSPQVHPQQQQVTSQTCFSSKPVSEETPATKKM